MDVPSYLKSLFMSIHRCNLKSLVDYSELQGACDSYEESRQRIFQPLGNAGPPMLFPGEFGRQLQEQVGKRATSVQMSLLQQTYVLSKKPRRSLRANGFKDTQEGNWGSKGLFIVIVEILVQLYVYIFYFKCPIDPESLKLVSGGPQAVPREAIESPPPPEEGFVTGIFGDIVRCQSQQRLHESLSAPRGLQHLLGTA